MLRQYEIRFSSVPAPSPISSRSTCRYILRNIGTSVVVESRADCMFKEKSNHCLIEINKREGLFIDNKKFWFQTGKLASFPANDRKIASFEIALMWCDNSFIMKSDPEQFCFDFLFYLRLRLGSRLSHYAIEIVRKMSASKTRTWTLSFLNILVGLFHQIKSIYFKLENVRRGCPISRARGSCIKHPSIPNWNLEVLAFEGRGKPE